MQPDLGTREVLILELHGLRFRDLNRDGVLTPYEDWRLAPGLRAMDLVSRMTLEEKAGAMMHGSLPAPGSAIGFSDRGYDLEALAPQILAQNVTSFITRLAVTPARMAEENNRAQALAEQGRLGIPLTVSTDPRHHFQHVLGASTSAGGYSQWPETLGFGALRDIKLMRRFADMARQEYRATGIHQALSPQADLFTEPRWPRGTGTFGSSPTVTRDLVQAYVEGFQGSDRGLTRGGVLTVVKHWVGYGATPEGWDGHNFYGRYADASNRSFQAHVDAFLGAFRSQVGAVMPTYSIVRGVTVSGRPLEQVGAGFNRQLLTELLRGKYRFDGIILSDWAITNDCTSECSAPEKPQPVHAIAMPWGVEHLTRLQRFAKGIDAGLDQFGGEKESNLVVDAVRKGWVSEERIAQSAVRVMEPKFRMGLFENPYVDPAMAARSVGRAEILAEAHAAQAASQVLLKNEAALPLLPGTRVWLKDIDADQARARGLVVVDRPSEAQFALVRLGTPYERPHEMYFFGSQQNEGRLDFRPGEPGYDLVTKLSGETRVVLALLADRPAVLGPIAARSAAILVNFGVSDAALLDVLTGKASARGRLPFEFPATMKEVQTQDPAVPDDTRDPSYPYGAGLLPGKKHQPEDPR